MKADGAQRLTGAPAPFAVGPRAHDEHVDGAGIEALRPAAGLQGPEEVFGIEPPADRHHGAMDVVEVRADVPRLPPAVIIRVCQEFRPTPAVRP